MSQLDQRGVQRLGGRHCCNSKHLFSFSRRIHCSYQNYSKPLCHNNYIFFKHRTIFLLSFVQHGIAIISATRTILYFSTNQKSLTIWPANQGALATFVIVWAGAVNYKSDKFLTLDSVAKFGFFYMFKKSHLYK